MQKEEIIEKSRSIEYYFFFVISIRSGDAIQIEEYVPTTVPKSRARVNPFKLSGPKMNIARTTINTVEEVRSDLRSVSVIDLSISPENEIFLSPS